MLKFVSSLAKLHKTLLRCPHTALWSVAHQFLLTVGNPVIWRCKTMQLMKLPFASVSQKRHT